MCYISDEGVVVEGFPFFIEMEEKVMRLSAPKQITWVIAVILGVLGVIGGLVETLPILGEYGGWLVFAGFALLAIATMVDGL